MSLGPGPAEEVRVSLATVVAARVEQEHAVAVADEHPGLRQLPLTGWIRDHRGTFRDGTYQATRSRPSLVLIVNSS